MMTLSERLSDYVRACFTGIWVQTFEPDEAIAEIGKLCRRSAWTLAKWDVSSGLAVADQSPDNSAVDPLATIRAAGHLTSTDGTAVLVLRNFHRFLGSIEIVQALENQLSTGKQDRIVIVILAPVVQIPIELERQFVVVEHEMPSRNELLEIAQDIATEPDDLPAEPETLERLLDAASGMTRVEAENAFSLSVVRADDRRAAGDALETARITPEVLWELKMADLKKFGLLEMHRGGERFDDLAGLDNLKQFCRRALANTRRTAKARGVLLLGVSGTGKSQFAKALGNEVGRPTIVLDLGRLKGSLVGQTEERTRQALRRLSANRPNVAFTDEIEKGLAAVQGSAVSDGGVSAGQFGALLSHMVRRITA
jgi:SpoVK/Ycf46/Vps4 family AAA+-type ATPase